MKELPRIPTPPAMRWREFRIRGLPLLVVAGAVAVSVYIWSHYVVPSTLVGQVEAPRAEVRSRLPGTLAQLRVTQFSPVKTGQAIAEVITTDPKVLESSLAVIRAEVELLRISSDPILNRERNRLDYERMRLALLDERVTLAVSRVHLQYAQSELRRVEALHQGGAITNIASQAEYEIALRDRDSLEREIAERSAQIAQIEADLRQLPAATLTNALSKDSETFRATLDLQEQRLRLTEAEMRPLTLVAPIDGTVSMVYRQPGESIVAGEPIATIVSTNSDRIVGYVIPPVRVEPVVGMPVSVRTRTVPYAIARAQIVEVGPHMDLVPPMLLVSVTGVGAGLNNRPLMGNNQVLDVGIPIAVSLPPSLRLRPGELVDLTLDQKTP